MSIEHLASEAYRLQLLSGLERTLWCLGLPAVAGVDEVGRGSLAGPVVAAAVIVDPFSPIHGVDDSKALSPERREAVAERIRHEAIGWAVAAERADVIDRTDILEATRRAMRRAIADLAPTPDGVVVDAVELGDLGMPCLRFVKGDSLSYSIACASIVAKVERDRLMTELDLRYPHYGFARHKGYGAPEHLAALANYGPCPLHRLTFRTVVPRTQSEIH